MSWAVPQWGPASPYPEDWAECISHRAGTAGEGILSRSSSTRGGTVGREWWGCTSPMKHPESAALLQVPAEPSLGVLPDPCAAGSAGCPLGKQCLAHGLLQAQATGQPARSHWHVPPGPSLATAATPCVLGAPQMSQPHTAPVPATGRTREALLGGCRLPAGDLQMVEENGAFARYIRMVQHSHAAAGEQPLGQSGMCTRPGVPLLPAQRALG